MPDGATEMEAARRARAEEERARLQAELERAAATLRPSASARKQRGKQLKKSVVDHSRLRSSHRSETNFAFRCSHDLKQRLAQRRQAMHGTGERFNEWMERVLEDALGAEDGKGRGDHELLE
jgi:hypothetical protein